MEEFHLYKDIKARTGGEIFLGVVGPVRTGKSTFVRHFMELLVLPNLKDNEKKIATDELPTSGKGKTITTVEPKFVPKEAALLRLPDQTELKVRLVDCVGFPVTGADGITEKEKPRMVKTPWGPRRLSGITPRPGFLSPPTVLLGNWGGRVSLRRKNGRRKSFRRPGSPASLLSTAQILMEKPLWIQWSFLRRSTEWLPWPSTWNG